MVQNSRFDRSSEQSDIDSLLELLESDAAQEEEAYTWREQRDSPSLPVILIGAASGIASGIVGFYLAFLVLQWPVEISAAAATLAMCIGLGLAGGLLSALSGSRAALGNIGFSCGLIVLSLLFFGLCAVVGAVTAMLILTWGG